MGFSGAIVPARQKGWARRGTASHTASKPFSATRRAKSGQRQPGEQPTSASGLETGFEGFLGAEQYLTDRPLEWAPPPTQLLRSSGARAWLPELGLQSPHYGKAGGEAEGAESSCGP